MTPTIAWPSSGSFTDSMHIVDSVQPQGVSAAEDEKLKTRDGVDGGAVGYVENGIVGR